MEVWILIAYFIGTAVPSATYLDYGYATKAACEAHRENLGRTAHNVSLVCQRIVVKN